MKIWQFNILLTYYWYIFSKQSSPEGLENFDEKKIDEHCNKKSRNHELVTIFQWGNFCLLFQNLSFQCNIIRTCLGMTRHNWKREQLLNGPLLCTLYPNISLCRNSSQNEVMIFFCVVNWLFHFFSDLFLSLIISLWFLNWTQTLKKCFLYLISTYLNRI